MNEIESRIYIIEGLLESLAEAGHTFQVTGAKQVVEGFDRPRVSRRFPNGTWATQWPSEVAQVIREEAGRYLTIKVSSPESKDFSGNSVPGAMVGLIRLDLETEVTAVVAEFLMGTGKYLAQFTEEASSRVDEVWATLAA